ncbi:MAG: nickel pincer cofactor biosynthesis protein LarC [Nocardia sp.]|nr:nickel pincer cofactor biosynthesis protein LarC [Nocardia sp.]
MRAWLDVSAGVAGDMLLGALVDAGAAPAALQRAIDAVVPGAVELVCSEVMRAGMRARKVDPVVRAPDQPHRHWSDIRAKLRAAALPEPVRADALRVFGRLAEAEAGIHGVSVEDVHFHEVGALDAIADIVGVCAGLHELEITQVTVGPIALGSGTVRAAHGDIPVPVPAVLAMAGGWPVRAGGDGELATPTGVALLTALATDRGPLPEMCLHSVGIGAGSKDFRERPNVVRVVLGTAVAAPAVTGSVIVEANIDDLDPRVWPSVLHQLLDAGAEDAWLTPILMKKGRPAHTVHALASHELADAVSAVLFAETSTIGLRRIEVGKTALPRTWVTVPVTGGEVRIKIAHQHGRIAQATTEFEDAAAVARTTGRPLHVVLHDATAAAVAHGLVIGAPQPG